MSDHFLILEKNWMRLETEHGGKNVKTAIEIFLYGSVKDSTDLSLDDRRILVRDTQFPSITPLPTVGTDPFLQAE